MFVEVPIVAVSDETEELRLLALETPFGEGYTTPGQYLKVKLDDKESYFALASAPSRGGRRRAWRPGCGRRGRAIA